MGRAERENQEKKEAKNGILKEMIPYIILLAVVLLLRIVILINAVIPSESMENTILRHTRVMGLKCSYWFSEPQRGDIIVFDAPDEPGTLFVKRLIGVPGDEVEVTAGKVYLNGQELEEEYLKEEPYDWTGDFGPVTVPEGCYFFMGDNRNDSLDARYWENTWVTEDKMVGKVYFSYWPLSRIRWIADSDGKTFEGFE